MNVIPPGNTFQKDPVAKKEGVNWNHKAFFQLLEPWSILPDTQIYS
jgi:hypothetical protein